MEKLKEIRSLMLKKRNFFLIVLIVLTCSVLLHAMENYHQYELTHTIQSEHVKEKITFVKMFDDYQLVTFNELGSCEIQLP